MRLGTGIAAVGMLLLLAGGTARADSEEHRNSLRGLTGVAVRVEPVSQVVRMYGANDRRIQADVEAKLQEAGITVLTPEQVAEAPGHPTLYIFVNAKRSYLPDGVDVSIVGTRYVAMITVSLLQDAVAVRDKDLQLPEAKTWDAGYLIGLEGLRLRQARDTVSDLVDEFIADWKTVNNK